MRIVYSGDAVNTKGERVPNSGSYYATWRNKNRELCSTPPERTRLRAISVGLFLSMEKLNIA